MLTAGRFRVVRRPKTVDGEHRNLMYVCHPILLAITVAFGVWAVLFSYEYFIERAVVRGGGVITLTPYKRDRTGNELKPLQEHDVHEFDPRLEHYLKVAEILITLASASLVFIPTLHFSKVNCLFASAMVLLGFTVVYGLGFMATMTYFYEMFLFNPASYSAGRSSLMFSLGFSGFACFAIAYVVIAVQIALAYTSGTLSLSSH
jgi:hypothetical protein